MYLIIDALKYFWKDMQIFGKWVASGKEKYVVEFMDVMETLYCISILHFLKFELYEYITQTK